jgi:serine/alanine adding enzyme
MAGDFVVIPLAERAQWEAVAGESRVPSHGWEFCAALADSGPAPSLARISNAGSLLIMPFVERSWANTVYITTITTVSGAAWFDPDPVLLDGWSDYARSRGWVAGYMQLHPDTDLARVPSVVPGNSVFVVDLRGSDLLAGASTIVRRKLKRASAAGAKLCEDRHLIEEAVVRLYRETLVRVHARDNYAYSEPTLRRWIRDPMSVVFGAIAGDGIEACALFLQRDDQAEYHLGASTNAGRGLQTLLLHTGMLRLREMGVRRLNLGGGVRHGDGLFQFKAKFGGEERVLHAVRQIYRRDVYRRLTDEAAASPDETWFPAYRAPACSKPS